MKEGWEYKRLGDICEIERGGSPRPIKDFITNDPSGLNWIKIGDTEQNGKYIYRTREKIKPEGLKKTRWVEVNDFLLSNSMSFGRPYILKTNGCIHDGWLVLRNYQKILLADFFYYLLTSPKVQSQFRIKAQGSTVNNLNTQRVSTVNIGYPPLPEQHQIVSFLDSEFEKIDALKANAEKQLQAAKDLFQATLKELMTPKEGWEEKELKTICQVINGRAYKQDEMLQVGKYRLLRVGNFFTNDKWYYSDLELEDDKYCCNGDLLYAWSASFGPRIWNGEKVIYHYHIWKLICSDCIDKHYLFYWLDSDIFKTQVMRDLHGATMNHITKSIMETTIVWFPCIDTQKKIADRLDALSANVKALQTNYAETITLCNDLKQALLKKVFEEDG